MIKKIFHKLFTNKTFVSKLYPNRIGIIEQIVNNSIFQEFIRDRFSSNCKQFVRSNFLEEISYVNDEIIQNKPIIYLEFGVWKGLSIRNMVEKNTNPESIFVGFDTFTGLPENWNKQYPKGTFDVDGSMPNIDDKRVFFYKGLFQETLPKFLEASTEEHARIYLDRKRLENSILILNMDADLYSSTLYVLTMLNEIIKPGTIIRFDEFGDLTSECMAFRDYVRSYYRDFEIISCDEGLRHVIVIVKK